jgi:hypothetical protein
MALGTVAAVILRLVFASVVAKLMVIPYLKIASGVALCQKAWPTSRFPPQGALHKKFPASSTLPLPL